MDFGMSVHENVALHATWSVSSTHGEHGVSCLVDENVLSYLFPWFVDTYLLAIQWAMSSPYKH